MDTSFRAFCRANKLLVGALVLCAVVSVVQIVANIAIMLGWLP